MKYFPFLRGKQHEILALSSLVSEITATDSIVPILERCQLLRPEV